MLKGLFVVRSRGRDASAKLSVDEPFNLLALSLSGISLEELR